MQIPLKIDVTAPISLQEQLIGQLRTSISTGCLKPGSRLPGTRALSDQLGVSRNTVVIAYDRLVSEGYIQSREGAGTFVSPVAPDQHQHVQTPPLRVYTPDVTSKPTVLADSASSLLTNRALARPDFDFELEAVDPDLFPSNVWRRLMTRRMQSSRFNLTRNDLPNGSLGLREALRGFLGATRGMTVDVDQIVIVTGIQQALNVVGRLFVSCGTPIILEMPGCSLIAGLYEGYGGMNIPVGVDHDGLRIDQLPSCRQGVAFVTPSRHWPLGGVLPAARRQGLLDWAAATDSRVVDVDFDSDFRYDGTPPPALQTLDRTGRFIYTGSFAMTIGAGLRIGYMVLPLDLVERAIYATALLEYGFPCHGVPWLEQAVLTDFIDSGGYDQHLRRLRLTYLERRDCLVTNLRKYFGDVELRGMASGTHLIWRLPSDIVNAPECEARARAAGVAVYTLKTKTVCGADYVVPGARPNDWERHLLLGFAGLNVPTIGQAVARLASALE